MKHLLASRISIVMGTRAAFEESQAVASKPMIYNHVMTKDKRQIHLDPMEWRDAMKKVPGKAPMENTSSKNAPAKEMPVTNARAKKTPTRKKG
jgi:hypothetical protein